jgi:hypothetical protein
MKLSVFYPIVVSCKILTPTCEVDSELLIHSVIRSGQPKASNGFIATFLMHSRLYPFIACFPNIPYVVINGVTNLYAIIHNSILSIIVHLVLIEY